VMSSTIFKSEVLLLSVPEVPEAEEYGAVIEEIQELRHQAEEESREYLTCIADILSEDGINSRIIVNGSRPAQEIAAVAEEENVDVIMMATHGRGGFDRLFMGSIAERTVKITHCPVFLVPIHERRGLQNSP